MRVAAKQGTHRPGIPRTAGLRARGDALPLYTADRFAVEIRSHVAQILAPSLEFPVPP